MLQLDRFSCKMNYNLSHIQDGHRDLYCGLLVFCRAIMALIDRPGQLTAVGMASTLCT